MVITGCFLATITGGHDAIAQRASEPAERTIARTFELRARPGLDVQLDEGYRRHLDWHSKAGERWAWYLWEITNGERASLYVDGTFGHAWPDFDTAVDPPGDGGDNAVNIEPFASRAANQLWRLRAELGGASVDPESAPLVLRTEYRVRAGADSAFLAALGRLHTIVGMRPYAVFELLSGGESPTYVLWVPAASWADVGAFQDRTTAVGRLLTAGAVRVRSELWSFRRDLSLCRRVVSRCHGTLPSAPPNTPPS